MDYTIQDLTPKAVFDIIQRVGGGMVQSVVLAVEIITSDGHHRNLFLWDNESNIALHLGLKDLLVTAMEIRKDEAFCEITDDDDDDEEDGEGETGTGGEHVR